MLAGLSIWGYSSSQYAGEQESCWQALKGVMIVIAAAANKTPLIMPKLPYNNSLKYSQYHNVLGDFIWGCGGVIWGAMNPIIPQSQTSRTLVALTAGTHRGLNLRAFLICCHYLDPKSMKDNGPQVKNVSPIGHSQAALLGQGGELPVSVHQTTLPADTQKQRRAPTFRV